jgi:hypothetical protein
MELTKRKFLLKDIWIVLREAIELKSNAVSPERFIVGMRKHS